MVRISVDIDEPLNIRLMAYAVKTKGKSHGVKGQVIADILREFLKPQWEAAPSDSRVSANEPEGELANEPVSATSRSKPKRETRKSPIETDDQAKIREIWDTGERNISAIAKQFPQYTDRQVRHWINTKLRS